MTPNLALYTAAEIRAIEHAAAAALPQGSLMQRAGKTAANAALAHIPRPYDSAKVLVLAGPGNNGGDALEAACAIAAAGAQVVILPFFHAEKLPSDARLALQRAQNASLHFADPAAFKDVFASGYELVIDGLFGIGLARPIGDVLHEVVHAVNQMDCPVLALDVPSGLNADTGDIAGHAVAVQATETITFIGDKPGLHTAHGKDHAGKVTVADLGIDHAHFPKARALLNDISLFSFVLRPRMHNTHKGTYGDVAVIGGAPGMAGAAILSARTAAHCGAGRVFAGFIGELPPYDAMHPELMLRCASEIDLGAGTVVAGPGLGTSSFAHDVLTQALRSQELVLDADALNLLANDSDLQQKVVQRTRPALLTPHPLEAARLLSMTSKEVQSNRPATARKLAKQFNSIVVLKGSGTVIANPQGDIVINPTGNPALATAGSGDVLAGLCGALLAQGCPHWEAALGAVWLHGHAADNLVEQGIGPAGLTASELMPAIRASLNRLTMGHSAPSM